MCFVYHQQPRCFVLLQMIAFGLVGFHPGIGDAQITEELFVLVFQLLPVNQYQRFALRVLHHFGEQVGLAGTAGCNHKHIFVTGSEGQPGFLI